ncbi:hypothetical protein [uncultured Imperialibacter sp.]|uniref:hypothetical protein n=1 Tax=uncultured Imperialibacter sp. TaxID=1672639 RepID=UPI0030D72227|tara:strand:+ start:404 stop:922 length:519 start_codon:yes stop_codon:yes gene_type:complete
MEGDLKSRLMTDRSKRNIERLAQEIGADKEKFAEVMAIFFSGPYRVTHFSAHLLGKCCDLHPHLILPYLGKMIDLLDEDVHDSLKRNILRTMQFIDVPKEHWDKTVQYCFELLQSKKEPIAVKVFGMTVLANLCEKLPELKNELRIIIEDQMPYGSAGFKSRGSKILKKLQQ